MIRSHEHKVDMNVLLARFLQVTSSTSCNCACCFGLFRYHELARDYENSAFNHFQANKAFPLNSFSHCFVSKR